MLAVRLICVGKLGEKFWADAVREYEKRLGAYCKLEIIELPEQRLPQTPSQGEIEQALDKEAALIEAKLQQGAALRLSMSPMTFPHHLARVMVLEQLYRALNIAAGGKYHK